MRILLALLVFSLIIVFHEFGHFLLAKLNHIVVVEFSLGFGPRLLSVKKGETRYSLKLFPLGGFTPVSVTELDRRVKFKTVRQAAQNRSMDLAHLTYDQMDFIAERKAQGSAFKYTTYKGWLFGKAWKCYDESTHQVTMPERLNTIG